jgi:hypothetical protein
METTSTHAIMSATLRLTKAKGERNKNKSDVDSLGKFEY